VNLILTLLSFSFNNLFDRSRQCRLVMPVFLSIMLRSLWLRLWAYQHAVESDKRSINIFVRYQQVDESTRLAHSLGPQKDLIGVVNAYATDEYPARNNMVIAHELLHTVGAPGKYDLSTEQPIYPDGFAKPSDNDGRSKAEIMVERIPLNERESVISE
jgi:hypothetical protein